MPVPASCHGLRFVSGQRGDQRGRSRGVADPHVPGDEQLRAVSHTARGHFDPHVEGCGSLLGRHGGACGEVRRAGTDVAPEQVGGVGLHRGCNAHVNDNDMGPCISHASTLMATPPAQKFATIWAVTSWATV